MRRTSLALLACLVLIGTARGQSAWADKMFEGKITHDFGTVPRGAQLKYAFPMKNIWKVPLDITDVRVTCGCLSATPSTKRLQPGETGLLHVHMDGTRFTGQKTIRVFVTVGPQFVSTSTLIVSANARQDVVFNPGEIDFGLVARGQTPTKHIDVEYAGSFDWRVVEIVKSAQSPFDLRVETLPNTSGTRGYRLFATLKADAPANRFKQEILLRTNDPASPTLTFHIVGNIQGSLAVSPGDLRLDGVKVGATETRRIVVRGSSPFRILGVDGQGEGVTLEVPAAGAAAAATHILEVRCRPVAAGPFRRRLTIRTDLAGETETVTVEGTAVN